MRTKKLVIKIILISATISVGIANAQIPIEVYQNPQNLQVLSPDISPEELRDTMFAIGERVGLRCSRCHDFESDTPIAERDYASDEKELKQVAREMMRMVQSINETVSSLDRGPGHTPITVSCVTCHRGVSQPRQIKDVFQTKAKEDGLNSAIEQYIELRGRWYAMGAYDFTAWKLGGIAQSIFDAGDTEGGMRLHALNLELNSDDGSVFYHRAESYEKQGRIEDAIADFERAFDMEEESFGFLTDRIEQLKTRVQN
jgi:tetratricopeptide (TPR) repeat protein